MKSLEKVNLAVVGCGYWGKNLVRNFAKCGVLVAISDQISVAEAYSQEYSVPILSYDEVLSSDDINAVVISTPAVTHAKLAKAALEAGKHVFIEKPMAIATSDARELLHLAKKSGVTLMVGHLLRHHPVFQKLHEIVSSGKLGKIQYIYSNRLNLGKLRKEENSLWSFAPHDISMILALMGEMPTSVYSSGAAFLRRDVSDVTMTHLDFSSGAKAHLFVSWLHPIKEQKLVVVGEQGMAVFNDGLEWSKRLAIYEGHVKWEGGEPELIKKPSTYVVVKEKEPLYLECQHFLEAIVESKPPLTDGVEGLSVLTVLEAADASIKQSKRIFLGKDESIDVHQSANVDKGAVIGSGSKVWHYSHIMSGAKLGNNCIIGQNVFIASGVTVGDCCKIQNNVSLYDGIVLQNGVFCGPSCVFTNVNTPRATIDRKSEYKKTIVGEGASIGANATIVCGVTLGAYSFIGAGAVVTKSVPDFALMVGAPAKQIGWVSRSGERLGEGLVCHRTGEEYELFSEKKLRLKVSVEV